MESGDASAVAVLERRLDQLLEETREFQSMIGRSLPVLRNVSDRHVARAEAFAFRNSLQSQSELQARGRSAVLAAKAARRAARGRKAG